MRYALRTKQYALFLMILRALHLRIFEQPANEGFLHIPRAGGVSGMKDRAEKKCGVGKGARTLGLQDHNLAL